MGKDRKSKSAQIPSHIYAACEAEARRRRKRTAEMVRWTDVLFEVAEKELGCERNS